MKLHSFPSLGELSQDLRQRKTCDHVSDSRTAAHIFGVSQVVNSSVGKESACNAGNPSSIPGSGRSAGKGIGYPLQYFWASLVAQLVKNPPAMQRLGFNPWVGKIPWKKERLPTPVFWHGEFHVLYSPWGCKESDATERLSLSIYIKSFKMSPIKPSNRLKNFFSQGLAEFNLYYLLTAMWYAGSLVP